MAEMTLKMNAFESLTMDEMMAVDGGRVTTKQIVVAAGVCAVIAGTCGLVATVGIPVAIAAVSGTAAKISVTSALCSCTGIVGGILTIKSAK